MHCRSSLPCVCSSDSCRCPSDMHWLLHSSRKTVLTRRMFKTIGRSKTSHTSPSLWKEWCANNSQGSSMNPDSWRSCNLDFDHDIRPKRRRWESCPMSWLQPIDEGWPFGAVWYVGGVRYRRPLHTPTTSKGFVWIVRICAVVADVVPRWSYATGGLQWRDFISGKNHFRRSSRKCHWTAPILLLPILDRFCSIRRMFRWSPPSLDSECTATLMTVNCPGVQSLRERRYRWLLTVSLRWIDGCRPIASNSTRTRPNSSGWVVANSFSRSKSIPFNLAPVRYRSNRQSTTLKWSSTVNHPCGSMFAMSVVEASTSCVSFMLFKGHTPSRHPSSLYMPSSTADWISATVCLPG